MGRINVAVVLCSLLFLEYIPTITTGIRCYRCIVAPPVVNYETVIHKLCKDFDYSEKFIVDCPYSTFCMKKTVSAKIPDLINGTQRGCASQKQKQHRYQNKMWYDDYIIVSPYTEGCQKLNDKGARTTSAEYCYCKGDLCNSTNISRSSPLYAFVAVIVLFTKSYL